MNVAERMGLYLSRLNNRTTGHLSEGPKVRARLEQDPYPFGIMPGGFHVFRCLRCDPELVTYSQQAFEDHVAWHRQADALMNPTIGWQGTGIA